MQDATTSKQSIRCQVKPTVPLFMPIPIRRPIMKVERHGLITEVLARNLFYAVPNLGFSNIPHPTS